jgi:hypothetical protein
MMIMMAPRRASMDWIREPGLTMAGIWGDPLLREEAAEVKMNLRGCGAMHLRSWFDGEDDA